MSCKSETREIRGKPVYVMQWPASKAMAMQIEMLRIMDDECMGFVFGDWTFGNLLYVFKNVERTLFMSFVKECIASARVAGVEINESNFDVEFSGDLMFIYSLFSFVLEVNFKDFFVEGLAQLDDLKARK